MLYNFVQNVIVRKKQQNDYWLLTLKTHANLKADDNLFH